MKILILGSNSYRLGKTKVGVQIIAEKLSQTNQVLYLSAPSSIFDLFSKIRRKRFIHAWYGNGVFKINENLQELVIKIPYPFKMIKFAWQLKFLFQLSCKINKNADVLKEKFDLLITDASPLLYIADQFNAKQKIFRVNDLPLGFKHSKVMQKKLNCMYSQNIFDQYWCVSNGLFETISRDISSTQNKQTLSQVERIYLIANGVDLQKFTAGVAVKAAQNKAIYIGSFEHWVDLELICNSAKIMPDWRFELFGPNLPKINLPTNVTYSGTIDNANIPSILKEYSVGLIPFKDCVLNTVMERPLKFLEYLAAGLGVASVDYGSLKLGMDEWACYGNTPDEFANAIIRAQEQAKNYTCEKINSYLAQYDWNHIFFIMQNLIHKA